MDEHTENTINFLTACGQNARGAYARAVNDSTTSIHAEMLNNGWTPPVWSRVDWAAVELRCLELDEHDECACGKIAPLGTMTLGDGECICDACALDEASARG